MRTVYVGDYGGQIDGQRWRPQGLRGILWVRIGPGQWKRHRRFRIVSERIVG